MNDAPVAAPTRGQFKPFKEVRTIGEALKHPDMVERFKLATPKHLSPERMLRVCAMAIQKTPKLAECDLMTLLGAMLSLASLGLEPNTPLGHAHLIPYEKREKVDGKWKVVGVEVQPIIGYRGYIDLARRTGNLVAIHADVIYEGDEFSFSYGTDMHLRHRPSLTRKQQKPLWAYFYCKLADGEAFEVLPYSEILAIRNAAEGYKSALRNKERYPPSWEKNPWVAFEHEMAAKTMIRRISKRLPMSIEMANAAALDAMSETGRVDFRSIATAPISDMMDAQQIVYEDYVPAMDIPPEEEEPEPAHVEPQSPRQQRQAAPPRQEVPNQEPPKPAAAPVQQPQQAAPPQEAQQFYLLDASGDPVDGGNYSDPVAYARALASYLGAAFPGDREAILDANAEYMAPAAEANPLAARLIKELVVAQQPAEAEERSAGPGPVAVPMKGAGRQDLMGYHAAVKASIEAEIHSDEDVVAWKARNEPTFKGMPGTTRRGIDVAIAERRQALGLAQAPQQAPPQEPPPQDAGDRLARARAWCAEQAADIAAMATGKDALEWGTKHADDMKEMKELCPEGYDDIRKAIAAKVSGTA